MLSSPPPSQPLFTIPITSSSFPTSSSSPTPPNNHPPPPIGKITCTCTQPSTSPPIYILTFSSPPDNRLTTPFCTAFLLALDILVHRHAPGAVVTTSAIAKFYSNGLDYQAAVQEPGFFLTRQDGGLFALWRRLLTCVTFSSFFSSPFFFFFLPSSFFLDFVIGFFEGEVVIDMCDLLFFFC